MHPFEQKFVRSWNPADWQERSVLLAISGGADSVAMLRAVHRLKNGGVGRLLVGHFNHGVRGVASDADEQFVVQLAARLQIPILVGKGQGGGSEASLRTARYQFLQRVAEENGARYVVTAHTADDQVETILHRIVRGTGISGLAGIPRSRPLGEFVVLMRPMLGITRCEVLEYLQSLGQSFCEDATNQSVDYTRNRIRHELLPLLARDYNPNVADALLRLCQLAESAQSIIDRLTSDLIDANVRFESPENVVIDCQSFDTRDRPLVRELLTAIWRRQSWPLRDMGFTEWEALASIAQTESSSATIDLPGPVRAHKKGESLSLTRLDAP